MLMQKTTVWEKTSIFTDLFTFQTSKFSYITAHRMHAIPGFYQQDEMLFVYLIYKSFSVLTDPYSNSRVWTTKVSGLSKLILFDTHTAQSMCPLMFYL